jgi:alpha-beta hydrolase superfamily lysophospholipase
VNPANGITPAIQIDVRIDKETVLPGRVWCAERPRALIAVVHGLGEHSGRYAALADALVARRFSVVSLDLPGHGEAGGPRGDYASWTDVRDRVVPAMFTVTRGMPGQPSDLPVVLLGHSMGGVMALDYALAHPRTLLGVVASAPALRDAVPPPALKVALGRLVGTVSPTAGFPHGLEEAAMSRDPEVLAARRSDPLLHNRISPRTFFALTEARTRVMEQARRLQVPALVLVPAADRVADSKGGLEFTGAAPHELVRMLSYKDAYHEIFNDPARDVAIRDLVGWLDAIVVV